MIEGNYFNMLTILLQMMCLIIIINLTMDKLINQNLQLKQTAQAYFQQIQLLTEKSKEHEKQTQTLLKFNQKLLSIIEKQLHTHKNNPNLNLAAGLHPISERTEIQSEMFQSQLNSKTQQQQIINIINQKRSLNVKPDIERFNQEEPLHNIHRDQNLSIIVDDEDTNQKHQLKSLISQFRAPIRIYDKLLTLPQLKDDVSNRIIEFQELKETSCNYFNSKMQELIDLRNTILKKNVKTQLQEILQKIDAQISIKNRLHQIIQQTVIQ